METALLIDIGSTYTKAVYVNLEVPELIGRSQAISTVETDVNLGLQNALQGISGWENACYKLACSSAAGGLKIIAIGLVPSLTAEAARRAALGAGSKVLSTYCYELTEEELLEIEKRDFDLILLAGGTDGGDRKTILHNARMLANSTIDKPIVIAGNKSVSAQVEGILGRSGKEGYRTANVMPALEELNVDPARKLIRDLFIKKIVQAKGLDRVEKIIDEIIMPTPAAVFKAAALLADGTGSNQGLGELMVIDIGGATTDVYSIANGQPTRDDIHWRGLKEPYQKRTVEGDLGVRYNARSLYNLIGEDSFGEQLSDQGNINFASIRRILPAIIDKLSHQVDFICHSPEEKMIEKLLARNAARISVERHTGKLKTVFTPRGQVLIQQGKDLSDLEIVVGTGGVIVHNDEPDFILKGSLYKNMSSPELLAPGGPRFMLDKEYILAACGLLAVKEPGISLELMKRYIEGLEDRDDSQK